jgi:hypothetical protein
LEIGAGGFRRNFPGKSRCRGGTDVIPSPPLTSHTTSLNGFTQKAPEGENRQTQTQEADEGEPPQEAFAVQELAAKLRA